MELELVGVGVDEGGTEDGGIEDGGVEEEEGVKEEGIKEGGAEEAGVEEGGVEEGGADEGGAGEGGEVLGSSVCVGPGLLVFWSGDRLWLSLSSGSHLFLSPFLPIPLQPGPPGIVSKSAGMSGLASAKRAKLKMRSAREGT
jgi:hypothetical protein